MSLFTSCFISPLIVAPWNYNYFPNNCEDYIDRIGRAVVGRFFSLNKGHDSYGYVLTVHVLTSLRITQNPPVDLSA